MTQATASMTPVPLPDDARTEQIVKRVLGRYGLGQNAQGLLADHETRLQAIEANTGIGMFSAYRSAALSVADGATVVFDAEDWDYDAWFDTATGLYTPQTAGQFRLNATVATSHTTDGFRFGFGFTKNGSLYKAGDIKNRGGTTGNHYATGSATVEANGVDDDFGVVIIHSDGATTRALVTGSINTYFQGHFVGAA